MSRLSVAAAAVVIFALLSGPIQAQSRRSLYERVGGAKALTLVVDDFVARAAANPKVNFLRDGKFAASDAFVTHLKHLLVTFLGQAFGGPEKYTGRDMKTTHRGMRITQGEFDALAADLRATLEKHKVGAAETGEIMTIAASTAPDIVEVR